MKNNYISSYRNFFLIFLISIVLFSCKKDWLNVKQDKSLVVPTKLSDFQALLDNSSTMNSQTPAIGHLGTDDIYIDSISLPFVYFIAANAYLWKSDIYEKNENSDWSRPYIEIYYANLVLEGINEIPITNDNKIDWNIAKGSALFFRSFSFNNLLDLFSKPYNEISANSDLGIPLRLTSNINEIVGRSSIKSCFQQIISDLKTASMLLPTTYTKNNILRPSKQAAFAQLARIYLNIGQFELAKTYADSTLMINSQLLAFSVIDTTKPTSSISYLNQEVLFNANLLSYGTSNIKADTGLYNLYGKDDLRKVVFFNKVGSSIVFKGNYSGVSNTIFGGLATDEIYLIRAEANARIGRITEAMKDLNSLLVTRWRPGKFEPYFALSNDDALNLILLERRKELAFRGIRWFDLRRLNLDPKHSIVLKRRIGTQIITLNPNDNRYVHAIPDNEIKYNNIQQNNR